MEAFKIIRKLVYYMMFFIASTLVFYFLVGLALTRYTVVVDINSDENLIHNIYLPFMYSILALLVMLISQFLLIGNPEDNEKHLYSISLLVFFGVVFGAGLLILAEGLVNIPDNAVSTDPSFFLCALIPALGIGLGEILYGIISLRDLAKKAKTVKIEEGKQGVR
jgi:Na+/proline symporter